jgi:16S rRNA (cytosine967-C5)-methyltransferase
MVETVAALGHERMKGLVNAVLKRVAKEGAAIIAGQDAAELNLPGWLAATWREAYGKDVARAIALACLAEPPLDLTVKEDAAGWAAKLGGVVLPTGAVRIAGAGRVEALEGYAQGEWWVQDAAASLPVQLLGDVRGQEVLDLCAAPGGKTAQLILAGALVTAVDKSARRLALLKSNLERLKLGAETVESDILRYKPEKRFDAILLDAPCSATGTLRRHPEAARHKSPQDIAELAAVQKRLLSRVGAWLKPGGRLLYCVCSLQPEEGERQMEEFMAAHPHRKIVPAPAALGALKLIDARGALRTHPACLEAYGGMDGFYAICLQ